MTPRCARPATPSGPPPQGRTCAAGAASGGWRRVCSTAGRVSATGRAGTPRLRTQRCTPRCTRSRGRRTWRQGGGPWRGAARRPQWLHHRWPSAPSARANTRRARSSAPRQARRRCARSAHVTTCHHMSARASACQHVSAAAHVPVDGRPPPCTLIVVPANDPAPSSQAVVWNGGLRWATLGG